MKTKPILEKVVEAQFMKKLKTLSLGLKIDLKCRKMNGMGFASWPDRLIIGPDGFSMWIEFKRPELGKLSEGQRVLFEEMRLMGHIVQVHDNSDLAIASLKFNLGVKGLL